jgi:predicted transcriptional regulator
MKEQLNVRIDVELKKKLRQIADVNRRSMARQIEEMIAQQTEGSDGKRKRR